MLTKANFKKEVKLKEKIEAVFPIEAPINNKPKYTITTSWDDGYHFDTKIAQLLTQYKLPGTFYIVVDNVGKEGFLTWDQIKDLDFHQFSIGSHTMSHPSDLKLLYDIDLHYEIQNSKDMIETVLGHPIYSFCYPRGRYDDRVKQFVSKAGYIQARTTGKPGITESKDSLALPGTIHIFDRKEYGGKSIIDFAKETIDRVKEKGGYVNIWGHSKEINECLLWNVLEQVLDYASK